MQKELLILLTTLTLGALVVASIGCSGQSDHSIGHTEPAPTPTDPGNGGGDDTPDDNTEEPPSNDSGHDDHGNHNCNDEEPTEDLYVKLVGLGKKGPNGCIGRVLDTFVDSVMVQIITCPMSKAEFEGVIAEFDRTKVLEL